MSEMPKPEELEKLKEEEGKKIRALVQKWAETANKLDVEGVLKFYAPDATLVWAGYPAMQGTAAIQSGLKGMLDLPGVKLGFEPKRITVADGLDMASEFGKFTFEYDEKPGKDHKYEYQTYTNHLVTIYKYVVVWRKILGKWKVFYDCYNSDEIGY